MPASGPFIASGWRRRAVVSTVQSSINDFAPNATLEPTMNTTNRPHAWFATLAACTTLTVMLGINALARDAAQPQVVQAAAAMTSGTQV